MQYKRVVCSHVRITVMFLLLCHRYGSFSSRGQCSRCERSQQYHNTRDEGSTKIGGLDARAGASPTTFQRRRCARQTKPLQECHPERSAGSLAGQRSCAALRMTQRDGLFFEMYCGQALPLLYTVLLSCYEHSSLRFWVEPGTNMHRLAYNGSLLASLPDFLQEKQAARDWHRSYPPSRLVQMSTASIQFLMLNARIQCRQGTEGWGIYRNHVYLRPSTFAQKGLHAVIVYLELATE